MQIVTKSIRVIDYEAQQIYTRETPASFDEYVTELISYVNGNINVREFKTRSVDTEVIGCIKQILRNPGDVELIAQKIDSIAHRLLIKEIDAQQRVARMDTNVQKGSLVQALLLGDYQVTDLPEEKLEVLRTKLNQLPEDKHFDRQFHPVPSVINALIVSSSCCT